MNELLKYLALWQKKRNELPIDSDPQADWMAMQSLLDAKMPKPSKGKGFKGFGSLPAVLVSLSAAAMIYTAASIYKIEKHKKHITSKSVVLTLSHYDSLKRDSFYKENPNFGDDSVKTIKSGENQDVVSQSGSKLSEAINTVETAASQAGKKNKSNSPPAGIASAAGTPGQNPGNKPHSPRAATLASAGTPGRNSGSKSGLPHASNSLSAGTSGQNLRNAAGALHPGVSTVTGASGRNLGRNPGTGKNHFTSLPGNGRRHDSGGAFNNTVSNGHLSDVNADGGSAEQFSRPDSSTTMFLHPVHMQLPVLDLKSKFAAAAIVPVTLNRPSRQLTGAKLNNRKSKDNTPAKPSNIDWGILIGANTSGGFTPKAQNANFYGSAPVDPYVGLFATYKLNTSWSVGTQVQIFSPQNIVTNYTHANQSKVDSGQLLSIAASRKVYSVNVPLYLLYNSQNGFSFKAGPVISFPIKQINANSVLQPYTIRNDSAYYQKVTGYLSATQYRQSINFGVSAGVDFKVNRFIFGASYMKSLTGFQLSSGLGAFKSYNGTFQLTIGFQLDKIKP